MRIGHSWKSRIQSAQVLQCPHLSLPSRAPEIFKLSGPADATKLKSTSSQNCFLSISSDAFYSQLFVLN